MEQFCHDEIDTTWGIQADHDLTALLEKVRDEANESARAALDLQARLLGAARAQDVGEALAARDDAKALNDENVRKHCRAVDERDEALDAVELLTKQSAGFMRERDEASEALTRLQCVVPGYLAEIARLRRLVPRAAEQPPTED